jgi:hypothetical protein
MSEEPSGVWVLTKQTSRTKNGRTIHATGRRVKSIKADLSGAELTFTVGPKRPTAFDRRVCVRDFHNAQELEHLF